MKEVSEDVLKIYISTVASLLYRFVFTVVQRLKSKDVGVQTGCFVARVPICKGKGNILFGVWCVGLGCVG